MFFRIGPFEVVSSDSQDLIQHISLEGASIHISFQTHTITIYQNDNEEEYAAYKAFIHRTPTLIERLEEKRVIDIQSRHAHPLKEELPRTMFSVFQSLPGAEKLELRLGENGTGSLWTKGNESRCVFSWDNFHDGIEQLLQVKE